MLPCEPGDNGAARVGRAERSRKQESRSKKQEARRVRKRGTEHPEARNGPAKPECHIESTAYELEPGLSVAKTGGVKKLSRAQSRQGHKANEESWVTLTASMGICCSSALEVAEGLLPRRALQ